MLIKSQAIIDGYTKTIDTVRQLNNLIGTPATVIDVMSFKDGTHEAVSYPTDSDLSGFNARRL